MTAVSRAQTLTTAAESSAPHLYYGVIERRLTLDHIIGGLSSRPIEKLDGIILNILRCGIYQIMYMDSVPDNAAVNESVALAKKFRKTSASGMVNAVLRNFIRGGRELKLPKDGVKALSVKYSAPVELVKSLADGLRQRGGGEISCGFS